MHFNVKDPELLAALLHELTRSGYGQTREVVQRVGFHPSLPPKLQEAGNRIRAALAVRPRDPPARRELATDPSSQQALRFLLNPAS